MTGGQARLVVKDVILSARKQKSTTASSQASERRRLTRAGTNIAAGGGRRAPGDAPRPRRRATRSRPLRPGPARTYAAVTLDNVITPAAILKQTTKTCFQYSRHSELFFFVAKLAYLMTLRKKNLCISAKSVSVFK